MTEAYSGTMRMLRTPDILVNLGSMYKHNTEVLEQYVENGYDAGANQVMVVLERNRIAIFDNGHGLVPRMSAQDYDTLRVYKEDIDAQKMPEGLPFEVLFPELADSPSLRSFQWMMECIGLSSKKIGHEPQARGIKGLGALSYQQIANRVVWHSKPSPDLALAYYEDSKIAEKPPTYMLRSATADELRRQNMRYEIMETDPLKNPFLEEEVESGTLVELTELREGIERSLRPNNVLRSLQARFGNDIRSGKLKIQVLDRVTDETQGLMLEVPPTTYPGTLILQDRAYLSGGRGPFGLEIYYDPLGRGQIPDLARRGSAVGPITNLEDFDRQPWNNGKLSGQVDYPDVSDEEAPWDAQKSLPLVGPITNQWIKKVWDISRERIQPKIDELNEALRLGQLEEFSKILAAETTEAMNEIPEFRNLFVRPPGEPPVRPPRSQNPIDRVIASVVNEHNDPVSGAIIQLWQAQINELIKQATTGKSGLVSLGKQEYGRYRLRLSGLQTGTFDEDRNHFVFNLGPNLPGVRETFHIINGEPKKPEPRKVRQISPFFHDWPNIDEPYLQRLEFGVVEINTEATALRRALIANDHTARAILCSQYMSSAIAEYGAALDDEKEIILKNNSRLFGALLPRIMSAISRRRRS